jgi:signal transduction histidine kinase
MRIEDSGGNPRGFLSLPLLINSLSQNLHTEILDSALNFTLLQLPSREILISSESTDDANLLVNNLENEISWAEKNQTPLHIRTNTRKNSQSFLQEFFTLSSKNEEQRWSSYSNNKLTITKKNIKTSADKNIFSQKFSYTPISIFNFNNLDYLLILRYDSRAVADKYHQNFMTNISYFSSIFAIGLLLLLSYIFINQQILKPLRGLHNLADNILHNKPINRLPRRGFYEIRHLALLLLRIHRTQKHRGESQKILAEQLAMLKRADASYETFTKNMRQALKQQFSALINLLSQLTLPKISSQHPALSVNDELAILQEATQLVLSLRTQNTQKLEESWIDLAAIAEQSLALMQKYFSRSNTSCKISVSKGIPSFWGDPLRLQQLLLSALSRALECLSAGNHVDFIISKANSEDEELLIITITDNGFGLSEASRKQTYALSDYPARYNSDGTYASRVVMERIVALHSGKLLIEDKEAVGSSIKISMPFRAPPHPPISGKILPFPEKK